MTTESSYRIELTDVTRVSFECKKCEAALSLKADGWNAQSSCSECRERWLRDETVVHKALLELAHGFRVLVQHNDELPFILRFEVPQSAGQRDAES